ncbi:MULTISPECIES: hypothetical protein [unclassified Streptomyces]|uniref:hypothetical protein n=1 Tax=unclassified Streptomyces TaxID=2593676 RepID=UPI0034474B91
MSLLSRRRWPGTPITVGAALLGALLVGAPAQADPAGPSGPSGPSGPAQSTSARAAQADRPVLKFHVARNEVGLPQPAEGDPPQISWGVPGDPGGGTAKDVVVKIDVSGISAFTDVLGSGCPDDVCARPVGDIAPDDYEGGLIELRAKPGAALGTTGTARVYATSSNATVIDTTVKVTVGAVDLVVSHLPDTETARPGSTLDAPITVANTGSLTAQGVELRFGTSHELAFAQRFSNCVYGTTDYPSGNGRQLPEAVCRISTPVEPGKRYRLSTSVGFDVKETALFEFVDYQVTPLGATVPTNAKSGDGNGDGSGPVLALVPDGSAPPGGSLTDRSRWIVNAINTADLDVTGDTVTADPGDTVTLAAKIRNDGPASVDLITTDGQISLLVNIPKGTTAVKVPERCRLSNSDGMGEPDPDAPAYLCWIGSPFRVGKVATLPFVLKVDEDAPATTRGVVRHISEWGAELAFDPNKANNQSFFTVNVTDAAGTGDSAGGSGGNEPEPQTTVSATAQPNTTAGTTGGAGTAGTAGGGTGALAQTGSGGTPAIALASASVLAAGAALLVVARRRTARTAV